ncbi:MAG: nucleotide exchange factor GrpE [Propionibacteriaceae bacterium]|nr:nucleotide exchange factor GrpE [Propionibacteriaceae bacterium]
MSETDHDWDEELNNLISGMGASDDAPSNTGETSDVPVEEVAEPKTPEQLLEERTADLQRLQAEYVNYKRRVDRDRDLARRRGIEAVLVDLLPMLDGIDAARAHDELTGGALMLAEEVAKVATKYGLEGFGAEGDEFDPHIHEALMHMDKPGYAVDSVAEIFQRGYRIGDRIVRPARVGVASADDSLAAPDKTDTPTGEDSTERKPEMTKKCCCCENCDCCYKDSECCESPDKCVECTCECADCERCRKKDCCGECGS